MKQNIQKLNESYLHPKRKIRPLKPCRHQSNTPFNFLTPLLADAKRLNLWRGASEARRRI